MVTVPDELPVQTVKLVPSSSIGNCISVVTDAPLDEAVMLYKAQQVEVAALTVVPSASDQVDPTQLAAEELFCRDLWPSSSRKFPETVATEPMSKRAVNFYIYRYIYY